MNMLVDRHCPTCQGKSWGEREEHYEPGPGSSGAWVRTWTCGMCKQAVVKRTKESYRYVQTPWGRMTRLQESAIRGLARSYIIAHSAARRLEEAEKEYEYKQFEVEVDPTSSDVRLLLSVGRKDSTGTYFTRTQLFIGVRGAVHGYDRSGKLRRGSAALW